ncbi:MAG: HPr family phosphocarrier protein [Eubacterium sp.]
MIVKDIEVQISDDGARLIAMLVQLASQFKSKINIKKDDKMVNAKSIMGMMAIGLTPGQSIEVNIEGEDESAAAASIENYLQGKE